ncbi:hypothetical protein C8N35_10385 [Breoghania corrubedonensis]|uniref:Uncharacterized protein n=1 Tax=Breoghania corrubedonensis TaxID=665038 RepID=A0A2T5VAX9_9HYPH|nr:hypothetical protein C8N35_10385 [Breoghania corrubedonensis]
MIAPSRPRSRRCRAAHGCDDSRNGRGPSPVQSLMTWLKIILVALSLARKFVWGLGDRQFLDAGAAKAITAHLDACLVVSAAAGGLHRARCLLEPSPRRMGKGGLVGIAEQIGDLRE